MNKRDQIKQAIDKDLITYDEIAYVMRCSYNCAYNRINVNATLDSEDADAIISYMTKKGIITKEDSVNQLRHTADEMLSVTVQSIAAFDSTIKEFISDGVITQDEKPGARKAIRNYIDTLKKQIEVLENTEKSLQD